MKTGQELINSALTHVGERYVWGAIVPKNNPNYKGPWDCAEFASWIVFQLTGLEVGYRDGNAYTGFWRADIPTKCSRITIDIAKTTAGAVLLRYPNSKGLGGHIAFSLGNGKTIEAMNRNNGVKSGKIDGRYWDVALLINGISYNQNISGPIYQPPTVNFRLTNPYMTDPVVLAAKEKLSGLGIDPGTLKQNYDENMAAAVQNFQIIRGLIVDGIMGKQTLKSLKLI